MKKTISVALVMIFFAAFAAVNIITLIAAWEYRSARAEQRDGHAALARDHCERAAELAPGHAEYQRELCRMSMEAYHPTSGNLRPLHRARQACQKTLDDDSAYPYHWFEMSRVLFALQQAGAKNQPDPKPYLERALALDPGNPRFLAGRMKMEIQQGRTDLAWKTFADLVRISPDAIPRHGPELLKTKADYDRLIALVSDDPETALELAKYLHRIGQNRMAENLAAKIPAERLNDFDGAIMFSEILIARGKFEEAADFLARALDQNPANFTIICKLGIAIEKKGDLPGALKFYQKWAESFPDNSYLRLRAAMAAMSLGQTDLAFNYYHEAVKCPDISSLQKKIVYLKVGALKEENRDYEGALGEFRRAQDFDPDNPDIAHRIKVLKMKIEYQKIGMDSP